MCNCISDLENKLVGKDWKNKRVIKAEFISAALMFPSGTYQTTSEIEATLEGAKKPIKIPIVHSFCPMCGEPYPKTE